ncbi:MAG: RNA-directed DNA polymerase [Crocinitomicaceae bacterium]|nr:RNA-directed DNA polymerase [Crocinitomicaceae bacterium]
MVTAFTCFCVAHCVPLLKADEIQIISNGSFFMLTSDELISTARRYKRWMKLNYRLRYSMRPAVLNHLSKNEFESARLLMIENSHDMICFFDQIPKSYLEKILNEPNYTEYALNKKKGGQRKIQIPEPVLKRMQKKINAALQAYYLLIGYENSFGFVKKTSHAAFTSGIATNASKHIGQQVVLNLDLKDFFESVSAARIFTLFKSPLFKFNEDIAAALALLCTWQKRLPTGAPTSPILSNFICLELDQNLHEFSLKNKLNYSRYADDLTFSTNERITEEMKIELKEIICRNQFEINAKKWRIRTQNQKQLVTGLVVNEKVNVDRKFIRKIRAMIHDLKLNGLENATGNHFRKSTKNNHELQFRFINKLHGYIDFIGQVRGREDTIYKKFKWELVPFGMADS